MSDVELQNLIRMANQIAANFSFHDDQVERIADHIMRFWAPSMRQQFIRHIEAGGAGVEAPVLKAMQTIGTA